MDYLWGLWSGVKSEDDAVEVVVADVEQPAHGSGAAEGLDDWTLVMQDDGGLVLQGCSSSRTQDASAVGAPENALLEMPLLFMRSAGAGVPPSHGPDSPHVVLEAEALHSSFAYPSSPLPPSSHAHAAAASSSPGVLVSTSGPATHAAFPSSPFSSSTSLSSSSPPSSSSSYVSSSSTPSSSPSPSSPSSAPTTSSPVFPPAQAPASSPSPYVLTPAFTQPDHGDEEKGEEDASQPLWAVGQFPVARAPADPAEQDPDFDAAQLSYLALAASLWLPSAPATDAQGLSAMLGAVSETQSRSLPLASPFLSSPLSSHPPSPSPSLVPSHAVLLSEGSRGANALCPEPISLHVSRGLSETAAAAAAAAAAPSLPSGLPAVTAFSAPPSPPPATSLFHPHPSLTPSPTSTHASTPTSTSTRSTTAPAATANSTAAAAAFATITLLSVGSSPGAHTNAGATHPHHHAGMSPFTAAATTTAAAAAATASRHGFVSAPAPYPSKRSQVRQAAHQRHSPRPMWARTQLQLAGQRRGSSGRLRCR